MKLRISKVIEKMRLIFNQWKAISVTFIEKYFEEVWKTKKEI